MLVFYRISMHVRTRVEAENELIIFLENFKIFISFYPDCSLKIVSQGKLNTILELRTAVS
uniref:Uncharacterized protein n=1 Tax=Arundo donax TaxID=35708 RepID=A0A0A9C7F1_ARUDO